MSAHLIIIGYAILEVLFISFAKRVMGGPGLEHGVINIYYNNCMVQTAKYRGARGTHSPR